MACFLNRCWLIIIGDLWLSPKANFIGSAQDINSWNEFEKYTWEITSISLRGQWVDGFNRLRVKQNGHHFADDILKCIFLNENIWIWIKISLKFVPNGPIINIPALAHIMAWRRPGQWWPRLPTHICVARPQRVKTLRPNVLVNMVSGNDLLLVEHQVIP